MFSKILYINLDRREDRKQHTLEQLNKINWQGKVERISAVDGRSLDLNSVKSLLSDRSYNEANDTTKRNFAPGSYMTRGAIGCALSHRTCYEKIRDGNDQYVLIIEDDDLFDDDFNNKLNKVMNDLINLPEYDILYLGYHESKNPEKITELISSPKGIVFGTYAMIINKRCIPTLMKLFPLQGQIDSQLSRFYSELTVYTLDKPIIYGEHSFVSNLGTDVQVIEGFQNTNKICYRKIILILIIILFIIILYKDFIY